MHTGREGENASSGNEVHGLDPRAERVRNRQTQHLLLFARRQAIARREERTAPGDSVNYNSILNAYFVVSPTEPRLREDKLAIEASRYHSRTTTATRQGSEVLSMTPNVSPAFLTRSILVLIIIQTHC